MFNDRGQTGAGRRPRSAIWHLCAAIPLNSMEMEPSIAAKSRRHVLQTKKAKKV